MVTIIVAMTMGAGEQAHAAIYAAERLAGTIVDITGGGDFTGVPRFATNLEDPIDLCVGPGNELYVSEWAAGRVTVVTNGGDASALPAYASGLEEPFALSCTPKKIYVGTYSGDVFDITGGGDFTDAVPFATGIPGVTGLLQASDGRFWAASSNEYAGIRDITFGGTLADFTTHVLGPVVGLAEIEGELLGAAFQRDAICDFSVGGPVVDLPVHSEIPGVLNVRQTSLGVLAGSAYLDLASPAITYLVDPAVPLTDATGVDPYVDGIAEHDPTTVCGDDDVGPGEQCDDMGESALCDADCTYAFCGDGVTNAVANEECDDGDVEDGDGCSPSCLVEDGDDGGMGGGGGASAATSTAAGNTLGPHPSPGAAIPRPGCGCSQPGTGRAPGGSVWMILGLLLVRRRK